jgi:hypothetical protein
MSDPMFRSFRQPVEVAPPDPSELRRRGERRGRRTAIASVAGAVLVVIAVVAPVAALTGGDDKSVPPLIIPTTTPDTAPPPPTETSRPEPPTSTQTSGAHADRIPADFPIDVAYTDPGGDGEVHPPSGQGQPVLLDPCGSEAFAMPSQDRLHFQVTAPEYADTRELRTYPSADDAVRQMQRLRTAVAGCPRDASSGDPANASVWATYPADTGYDSFAVTQTYEQGLGGGVWVFTRVGRSILGLVEGGEFSSETARVRLPAMVERAKQIAPSMCLFTVAGC